MPTVSIAWLYPAGIVYSIAPVHPPPHQKPAYGPATD